MSVKVDLFLDGDIGLWALEQVRKEHVGLVFTTDDHLFREAHKKGVNSLLDNPNNTQYKSSSHAISVHYKKILKPSVLKKYEKIFNLHPGYLPWGRGYYPIFWALWDKTPAGATLHEMTIQVDQGPIVEQINIEYTPYETGYDVFLRVREVEKQLFLKLYPKIASGEHLKSHPQSGEGSYHSKKDFFNLKEQIDWKSLSADSFIKLIRYLTFPGFSGLSIDLEDKLYEVFLNPVKIT